MNITKNNYIELEKIIKKKYLMIVMNSKLEYVV